MPVRIRFFHSLFKCIPYLIWICRVFHLDLKCIPAVKLLITPTTRIIAFAYCISFVYAVSYKDHIYPPLEGPIYLYIFSYSSVHHWILLPWYSHPRHFEPERWSLKKRNSLSADYSETDTLAQHLVHTEMPPGGVYLLKPMGIEPIHNLIPSTLSKGITY